jgi:hypothetical protein
MISYFTPAYIHLVNENGEANLGFAITDFFGDNNAFKDLIRSGLEPATAQPRDPYTLRRQDANIKLFAKKMWPWSDAEQIGVFEAGDANGTRDQARTKFAAKVFDPIFYNLSHRFALAWVEHLEKKKGLLRGHLVVEFYPSDPYYVQKYKCPTCSDTFYFVEQSKTSNSKMGKPCPGPPCAGKLERQPVQYKGYYECAAPAKHKWNDLNETTDAGGDWLAAATCTAPCNAALVAIQSFREKYKCPAGHWQAHMMETSVAGGSHSGEQCPSPGCDKKIFHVGVWKEKYVCDKCGADAELVEDNPDGGKHVKVPEQHTACTSAPKGNWKRKNPVEVIAPPHACAMGNKVNIADRAEDPGYVTNGVPVPSLGLPLGVELNFEASGELWAHELGHTRHMEHTEGPGTGHKDDHDHLPHAPTGFTWAGIKEPDAHSQCWDRACLMSYITQRASYDATRDKPYLCGKCVLKLRGWKVAPGKVDDPADAIHD